MKAHEAAKPSDGRASGGDGSPADGNGSAHRQRNEQNPRPSASVGCVQDV